MWNMKSGKRITQNTGSNLKKLYLAYLTRQLKAYEIEQFPVYDYLVTLTDRDLQLFRQKGYANGAAAAPIGLDIKGYPYTRPEFGPGDVHMFYWFARLDA
jgi:hypothetical protein